MDIEALTKKFGQTPVEPSSGGANQFDHLITKFGGDIPISTPAAPAPAVVEPSYKPQPGRPMQNVGTTAPNAFVEDVKKIPEYILDKSIEGYKAGRSMASQGLNEIATSQPASGIGHFALGTGMSTLNLIGVPAVFEGGKRFIEKLSGNKRFADNAVDIATSGLPILKGVKITAAQLIPSNRAVNKIIETVGPENIAEGILRMRENPRLAPADVFPAVRSMSQGLATEVGPQQTILTKGVEARKAGSKDAVTSAFNETMGAPVNVLDKINSMKAQAKETGEKLINPVVEKAGLADITNVIKHIDNSIADTPIGAATLKALKSGETPPPLPLSPTQERLFKIRQSLRGDWTDKPVMHLNVEGEQGLHRIQKDLRYEAQTLLESQGSDKLLGGKLMDIRNKLVDAIDLPTKGEYKKSLAKYRDDMHIQDAFEKGQDILRNRPTKYEDRPELWAQWKKNANDDEIKAAREGARLAVDQQVNGMRNAVGQKGTEIPQVDFNAQKLKLLFDEKEVNTMFKKLKDERDIAETNHKIWEGSQTQFREGGQQAIAVRPDYKPNMTAFIAPLAEGAALYATGGQSMGLAGGSVLGYQAARKGMTKVGQAIDRKTNNEIANLALATGEAREALIDALSNSLTKGKLTMGQKLQLALPTQP